MLTPEQFADSIIRNQQEAQAYPLDPRDQRMQRRITGADGFGGVAREIANEPLGALAAGSTVALQSWPSFAASALGGATGWLAGPRGAQLGAQLGVGAGSTITEFANSWLDFLRSKGLTADRDTLLAALQNPQLVQEAADFARKRGMAVGAFSTLSALVAGRLAGPVADRLGGKAGHAAGLGAETGAQALTEAGGEAYAQVASEGRITNPGEVVLEGIAGVPGAVGDVPAMILNRPRQPRQPRQPQTEVPPEPVALEPEQELVQTAHEQTAQEGEENGNGVGVDRGSDRPAVPVEPPAAAVAGNEPSQSGSGVGGQETRSPAASQNQSQAPRIERVTTPDGQFETETEFEVVEADDLRAAEGELQPRGSNEICESATIQSQS